MRDRIIPCLLLRRRGLVKTRAFKDPVYLGDPLNIVRIFNDKEADELIVLDIDATRERREPDFEYLERLAGECFMPLCYGGGVRTLEQARRLFRSGFEKVAVNTTAVEDPEFVRRAATEFGSQSIVAALDVKRDWLGRRRLYCRGRVRGGSDPVAVARQLAAAGAGEILVQDADRDGTMGGYDLDLIRRLADQVDVPVIACGGAGSTDDLAAAIDSGGASAAAAGSLFVFHGPHRAVMINLPRPAERSARAGLVT